MSGCVGQNFQGVVSLTSALKTIFSGLTFSGCCVLLRFGINASE